MLIQLAPSREERLLFSLKESTFPVGRHRAVYVSHVIDLRLLIQRIELLLRPKKPTNFSTHPGPLATRFMPRSASSPPQRPSSRRRRNMDEAWERAVEAALGGQADSSSSSSAPPRTLTLDGSVKCLHGRLPPPEILERYQSLEHLSIANVGVSSLEKFPRLRNLHRLILSDNRIAGGLEFLVEAGLDSLRDLDLSNNRIQFLEDLAPLAHLRLVSLDLGARGGGIVDVDEEDESDAEEEDAETVRRTDSNASLQSDEDIDGVEEDGEEEVDEEEEDDEDGSGEEDQEDVEDEEDDGVPGSSGRLVNAEGEIDGHEQGEGDEDENGEIGEEDEQGVDDDRFSEEGDGEDDDEILHRTPGVPDDAVRSRGNAVASADVENHMRRWENFGGSPKCCDMGLSGAYTPQARYVHRPVPLPIPFIELHDPPLPAVL
ncbi:hypothetical protein C4D60_Mb01t05790 [Musa balbisiana]|uniref:Acidic leucine-rich nuclear phosphoprotein 32-related protein n=1 Tax=Musa balbisiana TaxID=52838 RepID=A0A4S8JLG3_MUSBA|nr:hypothetical protein C4D60_Mb01t05790 [Musa balbisiana]